MTEHHQPAIAAAISMAAALVRTMPAFVWKTAAADFLAGHDEHAHEGIGGAEATDDHADNTMLLGLGGRLRVRPSVRDRRIHPRLAGYDPGRGTWGVALEKKTDGHTCRSTSRTHSGPRSDSCPASAARTTSISDSTSLDCSEPAAVGFFTREKSQCDD